MEEQVTVTFVKRSQLTGITHARRIAMTREQYRRYNLGTEHVQDILPHLSVDDREFLISGITPKEWESMLPPEEE